MIQYFEEFDNLFRLPYEENNHQAGNSDDFFSRINMEFKVNNDFDIICNPLIDEEKRMYQNADCGDFHKETESVLNHPEHYDIDLDLKNNLEDEMKNASAKLSTKQPISSNQDSITSRNHSESKDESDEFDNILDNLLGEKEIRLHKRLTYAKQQELKQIFKNYPVKVSKSARIRIAEETGLTQRQVYNYYYKLKKDGDLNLKGSKKTKTQSRPKRN